MIYTIKIPNHNTQIPKKFQAPKPKLVLENWDFIVFQIHPVQLVQILI